ncbi:MAG: hypothetical protein ACFNUN_08495 [Aggregatibacter sp.]|uniref:hypothetical protein n=1 Tax=Aggregatibacter sp. TaxID=1872413 RepID=UPI00361D5A6B
MKPFDLQEALNGAPVKLRNGQKAYVVGLSKLGTEDGNSYIVGEYERNLCNWSKDGKYWLKRESELDIVGMWEEPKLTSEQVLEKAYQEDLKVSLDGQDVYIIIGKAKDGSYLLGSEQSDSYVAWSSDFGHPEIYQESAVQKSDTITVTLPKPFKPKEGEVYYSIGGYHNGMIAEMRANCMTHISILSGNCFRAESDVQAWLDAMKNALGD